MSQSPFVYDSKSTRPTASAQPYNTSDPNVATSAAGLNNYPQSYGQYQNTQRQPQAQQQQQSQAQQQHQQQNSQQNIARSYPYSGSNSSYSQFDQQGFSNYNQQNPQQPQQQQQQQHHQIQQQPQQQQQQAQQQAQQQVQAQQQQQQYSQNLYQQQSSQFPQQQQTGFPVIQTASAGGIPQYNQSSYLGAGYQISNYGQPAQGYAYPPGYIPTDPNSPYKHQPQLSNVSNINAANVRGPLQSLAQAPLIDPNQVPQRPKLTTTFWEDEGTVCYQVESRGISVSRREDTNFINGTKLLNVAGMTRGRRDGILKSEKVRYVVKIGAMNLKGVWIPFERALELARNEGIVDLLYPLFVKDIKELYQGPQFSGGLTAAANSNPKNIIPVTVTNSTYTPGAYAYKDKKGKNSASSSTAQHSQTDSQSQPQQQQQQQVPGGFQYGYAYHYPTSQDAQFSAQSQVQLQNADGTGSNAVPQYKSSNLYGYQQTPNQTDSSKLSAQANSDGKVESNDEKP